MESEDFFKQNKNVKYETVALSKLKPATYNPRKKLKPTDYMYQSLESSMRSFGLIDPIVVNSDYTIIAGHQRYNILKNNKVKEIGVIVVDLNKIDEKIRKIATELPYRDFMTVGLLLNNMKIKNQTKIPTQNNLIPDCWIYIQDKGVKVGRIQVFNNWSPYMVKDDNKVFVGMEYFATENDEMWNISDEDFINDAIDELVKLNFIYSKSDVDEKVLYRVKKAYPAYFGSYENFEDVKQFLLSIDNLYCIGRNGQHRYNNMDHSMLTAMETVDAILNKVSKQSVWEVNTEQEYHEETKK